MGHLFIGIGMGIKVQKDGFLSIRQFCIRPGDGLDDAAGDGVIPAHRNGSCACGINPAIKISDALNTGFVIVGLGQRDISKVMDTMGVPRVDIEFHVDAFCHRGNLAQGARAEVLIALRGAVACGVGDAHQRNVRIGRIPVERGPEECGNIPPVKRLQHHLVGV